MWRAMPKLGSVLFLSLALFGLLGVGCSSVENKFSCHDVCQRYSTCFDSSYDVSGCTSKCEADADNSSDKQNKLDDCHDCIGDKSCVSDIASCSSSCGTFVP
jgi:hypothetical protein